MESIARANFPGFFSIFPPDPFYVEVVKLCWDYSLIQEGVIPRGQDETYSLSSSYMSGIQRLLTFKSPYALGYQRTLFAVYLQYKFYDGATTQKKLNQFVKLVEAGDVLLPCQQVDANTYVASQSSTINIKETSPLLAWREDYQHACRLSFACHYPYERDEIKATQLFQEAAKKGSSAALLQLAARHLLGLGCQRNRKQAGHYVAQFLDLCSRERIANISTDLNIWLNQFDVEKRFAKAYKFGTQEQDLTHVIAQCQAGIFYKITFPCPERLLELDIFQKLLTGRSFEVRDLLKQHSTGTNQRTHKVVEALSLSVRSMLLAMEEGRFLTADETALLDEQPNTFFKFVLKAFALYRSMPVETAMRMCIHWCQHITPPTTVIEHPASTWLEAGIVMTVLRLHLQLLKKVASDKAEVLQQALHAEYPDVDEFMPAHVQAYVDNQSQMTLISSPIAYYRLNRYQPTHILAALEKLLEQQATAAVQLSGEAVAPINQQVSRLLCTPDEHGKPLIFHILQDYHTPPSVTALLWGYATHDPETKLVFAEETVAADGNCGFTALGISRQHLVDVLLSCAAHEDARQQLALEIAHAFVGEDVAPPDPDEWQRLFAQIEADIEPQLDELRAQIKEQLKPHVDQQQFSVTDALQQTAFYDYLKTPSTRALYAEDATLKALMDHFFAQSEKVEQLRQQRLVYCQQRHVYEHYVKHYKQRGSYLGCHSAVLYAQQVGRSLIIWQIDSVKTKRLLCTHTYLVSELTQGITHILFTAAEKNGPKNHFNRLIATEENLLVSENYQEMQLTLLRRAIHFIGEAAINVTDNQGRSLLHVAARLGLETIVAMLFSMYPSTSATQQTQAEPLIDVNLQDTTGRSALHWALEKLNGCPTMTADAAAASSSASSSLSRVEAYLTIIRLLIENGARLDVVDYQGRPALWLFYLSPHWSRFEEDKLFCQRLQAADAKTAFGYRQADGATLLSELLVTQARHLTELDSGRNSDDSLLHERRIQHYMASVREFSDFPDEAMAKLHNDVYLTGGLSQLQLLKTRLQTYEQQKLPQQFVYWRPHGADCIHRSLLYYACLQRDEAAVTWLFNEYAQLAKGKGLFSFIATQEIDFYHAEATEHQTPLHALLLKPIQSETQASQVQRIFSILDEMYIHHVDKEARFECINAANRRGETPLYWVLKTENLVLLQMFLSRVKHRLRHVKDAYNRLLNQEITLEEGPQTPLMVVIQLDMLEAHKQKLFRYLISEGAKINYENGMQMQLWQCLQQETGSKQLSTSQGLFHFTHEKLRGACVVQLCQKLDDFCKSWTYPRAVVEHIKRSLETQPRRLQVLINQHKGRPPQYLVGHIMGYVQYLHAQNLQQNKRYYVTNSEVSLSELLHQAIDSASSSKQAPALISQAKESAIVGHMRNELIKAWQLAFVIARGDAQPDDSTIGYISKTVAGSMILLSTLTPNIMPYSGTIQTAANLGAIAILGAEEIIKSIYRANKRAECRKITAPILIGDTFTQSKFMIDLSELVAERFYREYYHRLTVFSDTEAQAFATCATARMLDFSKNQGFNVRQGETVTARLERAATMLVTGIKEGRSAYDDLVVVTSDEQGKSYTLGNVFRYETIADIPTQASGCILM